MDDDDNRPDLQINEIENSSDLAAYLFIGWLMLASGLIGWVIGRFA